jgi:NAD(P)-dependent dehydrogenase (short-subunit alcohol dehydrogenase family)
VSATVFRGAVTIVTGAASGFGRGLATELARRGARVVVADVDVEGARETVAAIAASGGEAEACPLDVSDEAAFRSLVADVARRHGRLDILVNNAGLGVEGEIDAIPRAHWERIVAVNLWGVINGTRAGWDVMRRQGAGHIVNVSSLAGLAPMPLGAPYAATKFAVVGLTQSARIEGRDLGIRATAVCPGFITSHVFENALYTDVSKEELLATNRFRFLTAEDAARRTLDGVARNRAVVVFPWYARLLSHLWSFAPALLEPLLLKSLRDIRRARVRRAR